MKLTVGLADTIVGINLLGQAGRNAVVPRDI